MRILLYNDISGPCGGAESHIRVLMSSLRRRGYEVDLCAFAERLPSRATWPQKLRFVRHAQMRLSVLRSSWQKKLDAYQPDIVHCHNNRLYTASIMAELARRNLPVISSFHDYDLIDFIAKPQSVKAQIKKRQFELISQDSTYLSVPTRRLEAKLKPLHPRVAYLPYFINNEEWTASEMAQTKHKQLLYVGRMIREKGIFRLLEAMRQLDDYQLTCVGEGADLAAFEAKVLETGLAERVSILGFLGQARLRKAFTKASCLLLPSEYQEVFGIVGIEAQAMGLPCIASDVGGVAEWCRAGETGLLVKSADTSALVRNIQLLHNHPALYERLIKKGLQHQKEYFSVEAILPQVERLYQTAFIKKAGYPAYERLRKQRLPSPRDYRPAGNYPTDSRLDDLHPHSIAQDGCYTS